MKPAKPKTQEKSRRNLGEPADIRPKVKVSSKPAKSKQPAKRPASKTIAPKPALAASGPETPRELSNLERLFCAQYQIDQNGLQAYRRVKPNVKESTAKVEASKLLTKPNIKAELTRLRLITEEKTGITAAEVVNHAVRMVQADPRELVEVRIGCCRCCHGIDHRYQFTQNELELAETLHNESQAKKIERSKAHKPVEFDRKGGPGFDRRKPPHPDCPECSGEGIGRVVLKDTQKLSPEAARLLAGVKEGKDGIEIKTHSVDAAMDKLFRHHGLYNDKLELSRPKTKIKDMSGRKPATDEDD